MAEKPEDLNLPNAVISRLAKEALPENVNISKEARTAIGKAASVFVLYATSCFHDILITHLFTVRKCILKAVPWSEYINKLYEYLDTNPELGTIEQLNAQKNLLLDKLSI